MSLLPLLKESRGVTCTCVDESATSTRFFDLPPLLDLSMSQNGARSSSSGGGVSGGGGGVNTGLSGRFLRTDWSRVV